MAVKVFSRSPARTRKIAREIGRKLSPGEILLLSGALGSGKTVFVQGLAQGLGISQKNVRSPTFAIIQEYSAPKTQHGSGLCHVDLYRLTLPEIRNLGLEEYWQGKNWIVAVEWADRANNFFPDSALTIKFNFLSENKRELIFYGNQKWTKILKPLKKF